MCLAPWASKCSIPSKTGILLQISQGHTVSQTPPCSSFHSLKTEQSPCWVSWLGNNHTGTGTFLRTAPSSAGLHVPQCYHSLMGRWQAEGCQSPAISDRATTAAQALIPTPALPLSSQPKAVSAQKPLPEKSDRWMPSISWPDWQRMKYLSGLRQKGGKTKLGRAETSSKRTV